MINIAVNGQLLVRVTIQTVGRIGAEDDRVDRFLTRAVVTGVTGTGAVGRNVMLGPFDLGPGRYHVTTATRVV